MPGLSRWPLAVNRYPLIVIHSKFGVRHSSFGVPVLLSGLFVNCGLKSESRIL
jgi:hypothetical protein